jgi:hypothetical protein
MATAREGLGAAGTQTAALGFGGYTTAVTGATEEYDGNSWTNSNPLNTARRFSGGTLWNTNCSFSFWWYYISPPGPGYNSNRRIRWN